MAKRKIISIFITVFVFIVLAVLLSICAVQQKKIQIEKTVEMYRHTNATTPKDLDYDVPNVVSVKLDMTWSYNIKENKNTVYGSFFVDGAEYKIIETDYNCENGRFYNALMHFFGKIPKYEQIDFGASYYSEADDKLYNGFLLFYEQLGLTCHVSHMRTKLDPSSFEQYWNYPQPDE